MRAPVPTKTNRNGVKDAGGLLAVYFHLPFCVRKCPYCGFYSVPIGTRRPPRTFLDAVLKEIELRDAELRGRTLTSIYFGGGTPSLLPPTWVGSLLDALAGAASFAPGVEITLECNPGTADRANLRGYRNVGVNRLSVGVQSLRDQFLRFLGRIHSADEARRTLWEARALGFNNISADIIFGIPGQRTDDVLSDIRELVSLGVTHVSAYELTVEEDTPLAALVQSGHVRMPNEAMLAETYLAIHVQLESAGFEHYEVSNYARPGQQSRHNLTYWRRRPYVGLGPSAHTFSGHQRSWNVRSWENYVDQLNNYKQPIEGRETLSVSEALEEEIALSLRLAGGLDLRRLASLFGHGVSERIRKNAPRWHPFLELVNQRLRPSPEGLLRADQLAVEVLRAVTGCCVKEGDKVSTF